MRPVRLDVDGFASFREPATVDFDDANFFALVGPTGAGKSTVIDALTFALYGSVPRWNDLRAVRDGLAPTASRGTVRLIFDVAGRRYVVARELRRGSQGVGQRSARLERFDNPLATGADDDTTVSLAADPAGVTNAVEQLLGLSFGHFCQCVVLPQNRFADVLQAKPSERQEILLSLLGAGRYDKIATAARVRQKSAADRAEMLDGQLAELGDVTPQALTAAEDHLATVGQLAQTWETLAPQLVTADEALRTANGEAGTLETHITQLTQVTAADDFAAIDAALVTANEEVGAAEQELSTAQKAEEEAHAALPTAADRAALEAAARDHSALRELDGTLPDLEREAAQAAVAAGEAEAAATEAGAKLSTAQTDVTAADSAADTARTRLEQAEGALTMVVSVSRPSGVLELVERQSNASLAVTAADDALAALDETDAELSRGAADLGDLTELLRAEGDFTTLETLDGELAALAGRRALAEPALASARLAEQAAQGPLEVARMQLDHVAARNRGQELRATLVVGEPCPVCDQDVDVVPADVDDEELTIAQAAFHEADSTFKSCALELAGAQRTLADIERDATAKTNQRAQVEAQLAARPVPGSRAGVQDALAAHGQLKDQRRAAQDARVAAVAAVKSARDAADRLRVEVDQEWARLRAARDPLVVHGAPDIDGTDVAAGWQALVDWAHSKETELVPLVELATDAAELARSKAAAAATARDAAQTAKAAADRVAATAVTKKGECAGKLTAAQTQRTALTAALAGAPAEPQVLARLDEIAALDVARDHARGALTAARTAHASASVSRARTQAAVNAARARLRTVRDGVASLGAPTVGDDELSVEWAHLQGWTETRTNELQAAKAQADAAVKGAARSVTELEARGRDLVEGAGLPLPADLATVPALVAAANERARMELAALQERTQRRARLAGELKDEQNRGAVAAMLASLLRADQFPKWLAAEALSVLLVEASANLANLSGGQFTLTHVNGGDLFVVDHADADQTRSVRTLSGGETFQASLALALALSSQISAMGGAAAKLDAIFLDEGFGTLDPDTLESVAATLESLAQSDRMVGVVTHVAALAERIPVRFAVHRDQKSSHIVRESA